MTSFNELVIGSSQGFAFLLKIITEVFQDYVHLQGHGLAMISHKCEPSVSKEFNLFSVVDFYCLCVCHSNSPTVCSALKNGHLLCRIEHFHFLDGILTSLCIFYSILYTVLSLSWTVCPPNTDANTKANVRHAPPLPRHYMAHSGGAHTRHHGARIPLCTSWQI